MILARGTRLGPYEITEPLGKGGMGEVYRATDTRLHRQVAIKVVAERWLGRPELQARFRVEAEAVAALNHPHICQIYDVGTLDDTHYIVMENVDGETLAARLTRGPLPIEQALRVAAEIAGALGAAHRAGIVHRDIKPANVILGRDGAKLLDFGLAQLNRQVPGLVPVGSTVSTSELTIPGSPVGTWHYMSPEQIRGETTDTRSDVFALGVLLYEIVTGRRAFDGPTHHALVTAILAADPPALVTLAPGVPESYAKIVRTCLSKSPEDRWHSAADVQRALESAPPDVRKSGAMPSRRTIGWAVAAAMVAFVAGPFISPTSQAPRNRHRVLSTLDLGQLAVTGQQGSLVFTPDGESIIYEGKELGGDFSLTPTNRLYRYSLGSGASEAIKGTQGGRMPFVSPDGQWLGFENGRHFVKVPLSGGQPVILAASNASGANWGDDGYIVFGGPPYTGLLRVSAEGGEAVRFTTPRPEDAGKNHLYPVMLPGSRAVLYGVGNGQTDARIVVEDLVTGVRKDLIAGTMAFRYSPSGPIIYASDGALFAQPFDVSTLALTGAPTRLADGVIDFFGPAEFAVSASGDLAFVPGNKKNPFEDQMVLVSAQGKVTPVGVPGPFSKPRFSPDGTMISVVRRDSEAAIWIYDVRRATFGPATFGRHFDAIWNMDGGLTLTEGRPGQSKLVSRPLGTNAVETAITQYFDGAQLPIAWLDGGRRLLFERQNPAGGGIWSVEPGKQPEPVVVSASRKNRTSVSPDGRWLTYTSAESGETQVYLHRLDITAPRVQASKASGAHGAWSPDSRRLYYYGPSSDDGELAMWAVSIGDGRNPDVGPPVELFALPDTNGAFDMSPDGKTFVMIRHLDSPIRSLRLVQNWPAAFDTPAKR